MARPAAAAGLLAALVAAGCANDHTQAAGPETTTSRSATTTALTRTGTSTSTTTTATTTTAPDGPFAPASLPVCLPDDGDVVMTARWLPDSLPDGYELVSASSSGTGTPPPPNVVDGQESVSFTLVEAGADGVITEVVRLGLGWTVRGNEFSYFTPDLDQEQLTSVRGRPGSIASYVSRGGSTGPLAEWTEDGLQWSARGALTPSALSGLLDPLVITTAKVTDRSGRLVQVGRTVETLATGAGRTIILLQPIGWTPIVAPGTSSLAPVTIEITPQPEGSTGIGGLNSGGGYFVFVGQHLLDGPIPSVGSDTYGAAVIDDGPIAMVRVGGNLSLGIDTIRRLIASLHLVDPGDPRLASLPLVEPGQTVSADAVYCRTTP